MVNEFAKSIVLLRGPELTAHNVIFGELTPRPIRLLKQACHRKDPLPGFVFAQVAGQVAGPTQPDVSDVVKAQKSAFAKFRIMLARVTEAVRAPAVVRRCTKKRPDQTPQRTARTLSSRDHQIPFAAPPHPPS